MLRFYFPLMLLSIYLTKCLCLFIKISNTDNLSSLRRVWNVKHKKWWSVWTIINTIFCRRLSIVKNLQVSNLEACDCTQGGSRQTLLKNISNSTWIFLEKNCVPAMNSEKIFSFDVTSGYTRNGLIIQF